MPMRYADQTDVLTHLKIDAGNSTLVDRVTRLENALAEALDGKMGRSFGTAPTPVARLVGGGDSTVLVFTRGIVSVTAVRADNGAWDGTAWTGFTTLASDEYRLIHTDPDGISYGLERANGAVWAGPVEVTGVWPDQGTAAVPLDVAEAMTKLVVDEYRRLTSSPSDQVGPDGMTVQLPNGWKNPLVLAAIERHTVTGLLV